VADERVGAGDLLFEPAAGLAAARDRPERLELVLKMLGAALAVLEASRDALGVIERVPVLALVPGRVAVEHVAGVVELRAGLLEALGKLTLTLAGWLGLAGALSAGVVLVAVAGSGAERPGEALQALAGLLGCELVKGALGVAEPLARVGVLLLPPVDDRLVMFGFVEQPLAVLAVLGGELVGDPDVLLEVAGALSAARERAQRVELVAQLVGELASEGVVLSGTVGGLERVLALAL
jgi:hypothetical protein